MTKKFLIVFTLFAVLIPVQSQQKNTQFYKVKTFDLKIVRYPWANELHLSIDILAKKILSDAKLQISIKYEQNHIGNHFASMKKEGRRCRAQIKMEPLNRAEQEALPGKYTIAIHMIVANQTDEFTERWTKFSSAPRLVIAKKEFQIGKQINIENNQKKIKEFYIQRMKVLNSLYSKLRKKEVTEYRSRKFTKGKWRRWLYSEFFNKIQEQEKELSKHKARVYSPLYKTTLNSMSYYCEILTRIGKISTMILFKRHGLAQDNTTLQGIDPFAIKGRKSLDRIIEKLHRDSAREMKISLRKELGYFPPPK